MRKLIMISFLLFWAASVCAEDGTDAPSNTRTHEVYTESDRPQGARTLSGMTDEIPIEHEDIEYNETDTSGSTNAGGNDSGPAQRSSGGALGAAAEAFLGGIRGDSDTEFTPINRAQGTAWRAFSEGRMTRDEYTNRMEQLRDLNETYERARGESIESGASFEQLDHALERDIEDIEAGRPPGRVQHLDDLIEDDDGFGDSDAFGTAPFGLDTRDIVEFRGGEHGGDHPHHHD